MVEFMATWMMSNEQFSEDIVVDDEVVVKEKVGLKKDEKLKEDGKNNEDEENATFHDMGSTKDKGKEGLHLFHVVSVEGVSMVVLNEGLTMMICKEMSKRLKDPESFTI
nr:hypothetical protein Iba_chr01aCG2520 [Ipomoea batatas]GMC46476.1 hypothetical protein Iba_chr01aCG2540 [Ipomoea batatas]